MERSDAAGSSHVEPQAAREEEAGASGAAPEEDGGAAPTEEVVDSGEVVDIAT